MYSELIELERLGFNIWYDEGINPSHRWTDELAAAIDRSALFVAFITPRFVASGNCIDEIEYALRLGRSVLPVFLEPTELPPGLQLALGSRQAINKSKYAPPDFSRKLSDSIATKLRPLAAAGREPAGSAPAPVKPSSPFPRAGVVTVTALLALIGVTSVMMNRSDEPRPPPEATIADHPSIAVLPFTNVSQDPVNDPFTVGIHDDLLTHISKIGSIKSISRTSVLQYRNTTKPIPEIAAELGVSTVLEGGVQRAGDRVRINVQLVDAQSDQNLWGETYDRELTAANIFAIQSDIAKSIAASLEATLSAEEARRIEAVPTESLEAYEDYLLGNQRLAKRTVRDLEKAAEYFEQATRHDPSYALAWVGLANAYTLRAQYGGLPMALIRMEAGEALEKAFSLDGNLAAAHAARGLLLTQLDDNDAAQADLQRAIDLEPNYAPAYHWYAEVLKTDRGRPDLAVEYFDKALALDPRSAVINGAASTNLHMLGRFDEAFELNRRSIAVDVAIPSAYWGNSTLYWAVQGDLVRAARISYQARHLDPRSPQATAFLCMIFLDLGDVAEARRLERELVALGPEDYSAHNARLWVAAHEADGMRARELFEWMYRYKPNGGLYTNTASTLHALSIAGVPDDERLALYERTFPALLSAEAPEIDRTNYRAAIDLAGILVRSGNRARAGVLLSKSTEALREIPRLGWFGYGIADAEILALQGNTDQAARRIVEAHDQGWLLRWWSIGANPNLLEVRGLPEVQAVIATIRRDMAGQLEEVRRQQASSPLGQ